MAQAQRQQTQPQTQPADKPRQLPAIITKVEGRIAEFKKVLPKAIRSEQFVRVVQSTIQKQPDLLQCDPASVIEACDKAATDGLLIDGREAALIVFNTQNGKVAQYVPMITGLTRLLYQSGLVSSVQTYIYYDKEVETGRFRYVAGDDEKITHEPILGLDRGKPAGAYSIVRMRDGTLSREVMSWDQVMAIARRVRKNTDDQGNLKGIWKTDTLEMARKTVLRRHIKKLPLTADTARAFTRMDELYTDEHGIAYAGEIEEAPSDQPQRKRRGAGAAALADVDDINGETGEIINGAQAQPQPRPQAQRSGGRRKEPEPDLLEEQDEGRFAPAPADQDAYTGDGDVF